MGKEGGDPVLHFEILGENATALWEFYGAMFGWSIDGGDASDYGMVTPDGGIGGGIGATRSDGRPHVTVYVQVDSVDDALAQATSLGGTVALPKMATGDHFIGLLTDPQGNLIGVMERAQK
jgi:predicted enzyme related to lactoylglutathione lyase